MSSHIYIGTIAKTHGIVGECILSDVEVLPEIKSGQSVLLGYSAAFAKPYVVNSCKEYRNGALISFRGVTSISAAEALQELGVFLPVQALSADEADAFSDWLIGAEARDAASGELLGLVRDVWATPAHRTLVIDTPKGDEVLVPHVPAIVTGSNRSARQILLNPPEGMFSEAEDPYVENGPDDDLTNLPGDDAANPIDEHTASESDSDREQA